MGWLFGHKKVVPKVPFPEGKKFAEGTFRLPVRTRSERIVELETVKEAAGVEEPLPFPDIDDSTPIHARFSTEPRTVTPPIPGASGSRYMKVGVYRQILGEVNAIKTKITDLKVEPSQYNEEEQFVKLRRAVKGMHDRLLVVDKTLFKGD